jgi:hypothetical protein
MRDDGPARVRHGRHPPARHVGEPFSTALDPSAVLMPEDKVRIVDELRTGYGLDVSRLEGRHAVPAARSSPSTSTGGPASRC